MFVPIQCRSRSVSSSWCVLAFGPASSRGRDPLMGGGRGRARPIAPAALEACRRRRRLLPLPPEVEEQVRALLAAGRKIDAIKLARDVTHLGLKETKDLVESME